MPGEDVESSVNNKESIGVVVKLRDLGGPSSALSRYRWYLAFRQSHTTAAQRLPLVFHFSAPTVLNALCIQLE
jgi:hypothetical protein